MASLANSSVHLLLLVVVLAAAADAVTFTIVNKCGYTVWPAALPSGDGNQLDPGQSWAVYVPAGTKGARVWGRTGCGFISGGSLGQCQTGDCGGTLRCAAVGAPPVTVAEFSLGQASKDDYFDISLVDGFNAPMAIVPAPAGGRRCPAAGLGARRRSRCSAPASCAPRPGAATRAGGTARAGRPRTRSSSRSCARRRSPTPGTAKAPPSPAPPAPTTRSSSAHDELGLVQGQ